MYAGLPTGMQIPDAIKYVDTENVCKTMHLKKNNLNNICGFYNPKAAHDWIL